MYSTMKLACIAVSNPNGVNLHERGHIKKPSERNVSNPNGVNLHADWDEAKFAKLSFQTPTG